MIYTKDLTLSVSVRSLAYTYHASKASNHDIENNTSINYKKLLKLISLDSFVSE